MNELVTALGEPRPVLTKEEHVKKRKYPGRKPGSKTVTKEERERIIADYKGGMLLPDLVAKYKRSKSTIWNTARRAGLPFRRSGVKKSEEKKMKKSKGKNFVTDAERAGMAADYKNGMVLSKIIAKHGRSKEAVLRAVRLAGVPLRGRGHTGLGAVLTEARKKTMGAKLRKKAERAAVKASIHHANKALAKVHKSEDVVGRAVGVLIKSLQHEEIQEILIDFNLRQYKTTRLRVEEGRVV